MNKKILITIIAITILAITAGGFWYANNSKKPQTNEEKITVNSDKKQNQQQEEEKIAKEDVDSNSDKNNKKNIKQLTPQEIEKLKKEKDLVWYEIPELNIKFLVTKDIANVLRYRDFYVQDSKVDGKELYIKDLHAREDNKIPLAFADLIVDRTVKDVDTGEYHFLSKYCLGNKNIKILVTKKGSYRVCYLREIDDNSKTLLYSQNNDLQDIAKKLLQGYLEEAFVTLINDY